MKKDVITVNEFMKLFDRLVNEAAKGNIMQEIIKLNNKKLGLVIYDTEKIRCTFSNKEVSDRVDKYFKELNSN